MESKSELRIAVLYDLLWMGVVVSLFMIPAITLLLYNPFIFAWIIVFPIVFTMSGTYGILRLLRYCSSTAFWASISCAVSTLLNPISIMTGVTLYVVRFFHC